MTKACSMFLAGILSLASPAALSPEIRGQAGRGFPGRDSAAGWQQLGPNGGEIRTIVPNPQDKSEIWAVSGSNPALIFRSTDSGGTWKRIAVATEALNSLVAHPANGVLYALGDSTVYKSADHGVKWTAYSLGEKNYGWGGRLAAHPANPNLLYVAGYRAQADNRRSMAFLKSADGGKTWSAQSFEPSSLDGYLLRLAVSPSNPNIIMAGGYYTDKNSVTRYRIYKSVNGGKTWTDKTGDISDLVREIVAHPTNPNKFYIATTSNIWRTADGGATWLKNNGYYCGYCLAIDPDNPETLYAGYYKVVSRSVNGGVDWEASTTGLYGSVYDCVILPNKIICGSSAAIFSTPRATEHDAWPSWTLSSNGLKAAEMKAIAVAPSSPGTIYAVLFTYGIYKSKNSGSTWELLTGPFNGPYVSRLAVHPSNPGIVYALATVIGTDYFYRSADGGKTWSELLSDNYEDFTLSKKNPSRIFVAGQRLVGSAYYMGLHRSLDGGGHWTHLTVSSTAGSCGYAVAVDPKNDNVIYLGGDISGNGAIFTSTNQGKSWTNITGTLTGRVLDIAVDPKDTSKVYAATYAGVWKSENGGTSWTGTYRAGNAACLFVHPTAPNIVYAATYDGLLVSKNYGATWSAFDEGLVLKNSVIGLDINKTTKTLFAATYGSSVWKRKL